MNGEHVLRSRRDDLQPLLPRQPHLDLVAGRVRRDALVVEDHREREQALPDRLARLAVCGEASNEIGDVGRCERVDAPVSEHRQEHAHGASMLQPSVLGDVDATLLPALGSLTEGPGCRRFVGQSELRDALRGELAGDPAGANRRLALRRERAAVANPRLPPAQPVLDPVALRAAPRLASPDPDAGHERSGCLRRRADSVVPVRELLDELEVLLDADHRS